MLAQAMPKPIIGTNSRYLFEMYGNTNRASAASVRAPAWTSLALYLCAAQTQGEGRGERDHVVEAVDQARPAHGLRVQPRVLGDGVPDRLGDAERDERASSRTSRTIGIGRPGPAATAASVCPGSRRRSRRSPAGGLSSALAGD